MASLKANLCLEMTFVSLLDNTLATTLYKHEVRLILSPIFLASLFLGMMEIWILFKLVFMMAFSKKPGNTLYVILENVPIFFFFEEFGDIAIRSDRTFGAQILDKKGWVLMKMKTHFIIFL